MYAIISELTLIPQFWVKYLNKTNAYLKVMHHILCLTDAKFVPTSNKETEVIKVFSMLHFYVII